MKKIINTIWALSLPAPSHSQIYLIRRVEMKTLVSGEQTLKEGFPCLRFTSLLFNQWMESIYICSTNSLSHKVRSQHLHSVRLTQDNFVLVLRLECVSMPCLHRLPPRMNVFFSHSLGRKHSTVHVFAFGFGQISTLSKFLNTGAPDSLQRAPTGEKSILC